MKIIRIFGIVVGIHVALGVFLAVICVTPGCSSTGKPSAAIPANTRSKPADSVPVVSLPHPTAAPLFQAIGTADAPAASAGGPIFYSPTRPGTVAADAVEAQPVAGVTPATTYTVGQGDSWWTIAKKNHLKVSDLAAANNLKPTSTLQPGQKLLIPSKALPEGPPATAPAGTAPAPSHANPPSAALKHVVRRGETLGSIAHAYGLKIGDLAAANSISDPSKIHPGQELTIPSGGHAARTAKARSGAPASAPGPASSSAPETSAPAGSAPPAPLPAPEAGPGAGSGPGADVPVIKVEPSEPSSQLAPANPSK
jgi:LysM repeat protein